MKITAVRVWRLSPPHDVWILAEIETDAGLTGWGELTGSGHDAAVAEIFIQAASALPGRNPLEINAHLAGYTAFRFPPPADKLTATAWSGLAQALWDLRAQAHGLPLCALLGADAPRPVPLYANLNRGLLRDRSPEAHARHVEAALRAGFSAVKCTPFDEVTPGALCPDSLEPALQRLRAAASAAGTERIAIDCHQRFSVPLAQHLLARLAELGRFYWLEDVLPPRHGADLHAFRHAFPGIVWAGGEEIHSLSEALHFVSGPERPDVYMPDIKYICGPDRAMAACHAAMALGSRVSPHNPSGPVSQAFSAHVAVACPGSILEYPFLAVPDRACMTDPVEPLENGSYMVSDAPGIGIAPGRECLERYGEVLRAV